MSVLVVDASAAASWLLRSQVTNAADLFQERLSDFALVAPDIFLWEILNVLLAKTRRSVGFDLNLAIAVLDAFEVKAQSALGPQDVAGLVAFARIEGLSLFDATYLALAIDLDADVVSRDRALLAATRRHGLIAHDLND